MKTLDLIVSEHPYPDYAEWWEMGNDFVDLMRNAILHNWRLTTGLDPDSPSPAYYTEHYLDRVYKRPMRSGLVRQFVTGNLENTIMSGEFDALSYAYFRSAFEACDTSQDPHSLRSFTKQVGRDFFTGLEQHLRLDLPESLDKDANLQLLEFNINKIGAFLVSQGYLRDAFLFTFDVHVEGHNIKQTRSDFLDNLNRQGCGYAIYEMGYPVILPSAVYLFHTMGEAQHHSSRTIEELFERLGLQARETDDFDPVGYPSDRVVEFWEIRKLQRHNP